MCLSEKQLEDVILWAKMSATELIELYFPPFLRCLFLFFCYFISLLSILSMCILSFLTYNTLFVRVHGSNEFACLVWRGGSIFIMVNDRH